MPKGAGFQEMEPFGERGRIDGLAKLAIAPRTVDAVGADQGTGFVSEGLKAITDIRRHCMVDKAVAVDVDAPIQFQ